MAYDLVILLMMVTAIAGILYAHRETAKKGVRYIGRTRVPDRPLEHGNQPHTELEAPDFYMPNFPGADQIFVAKMASPIIAVAKWSGSIRMEEARARLQQQLFEAQKMEDLRGIASDFNDLLTVMLGSASLARYRLASEDPLQEPMRTIEQSAQRAAVLARRLAGFARPGPQQVMAATTDLRETVVKQGKILEYHGQTFDSMERRLRRLEEKAVQRRERATEDEPESETESPILN